MLIKLTNDTLNYDTLNYLPHTQITIPYTEIAGYGEGTTVVHICCLYTSRDDSRPILF